MKRTAILFLLADSCPEIVIENRGPLVATATISSAAPGCNALVSDVSSPGSTEST